MKRDTAAAAVTKPALNDAELERIHNETSRLDVSERVAYWDKRQSNPETATLCPHDGKHGALGVNGSGTAMICGVRKNGAWCTGTMPVSV